MMRSIQGAMIFAAALLAAACGSESGGGDGNLPGDVGTGGSDPTGGGTTDPTGGGTTDPTGGGTTDPTGGGEPVAGTGGGTTDPTDPMMEDPLLNPSEFPDIRGTGVCAGLSTAYPGDDTCIPPPEPGEGIQIHIGPADYNNPGEYEFPTNLEHSLCKDFVSPNTEDIYYQTYLGSARPGTHHIIDTCFTAAVNPAGGFGSCRAPGGAGDQPDAFPIAGFSRPYMARGVVAPENAGLATKLPANAQCQADMHYFNFTGAPVLKEMWLNLYTIPAAQVTEQALQIRGMGGTGWAVIPIPAGSDMVYKYQMTIGAPTGPNPRIVSLLGHYHAHGVRFTGFLNGEKVFEMFDYNDPKSFQYNSTAQNPAFSPETMSAGAHSGPLPIKQGDVLSWECHIVNDSTSPLRYTNEVNTGEMCNFWGESVDVPKIDAWLF